MSEAVGAFLTLCEGNSQESKIKAVCEVSIGFAKAEFVLGLTDLFQVFLFLFFSKKRNTL